MNMKNVIAVGLIAMAGVANQTFGITIDGVEVSEGQNLQVGSEFYFAEATGIGGETQGIGEILQISDGDGNVIWENGDNGTDLWFVFDDLIINDSTNTPAGRIVTTTGGGLQFYTLSADSFDPTGIFANDKTAITAGGLWLDSMLTEVDYGGGTFSTANLVLAGSGFNGTGFLDITGGAAADALNTDMIGNGFDSQMSDIRWNFSVDNQVVVGQYGFTGSSDFRSNGAVPIPAPFALVGLGIVGMMGVRKFV